MSRIDDRVLVAVAANEVDFILRILNEGRIDTVVPADAQECRRILSEGVATAVLALEALDSDFRHTFLDALSQQPDWSDIPVVVLAAPTTFQREEFVDSLPSFPAFVRAPVQNDDLLRVVHSALQTRRRQYRVRDQLARLAEDGHRYHSSLSATSEVTWVAGPDGRMVGDSPSWRAFTGQTYEQWKELGWVDAIHPDDRAPTLGAWKHAVETASGFYAEHRLRTPDGSYRWVSTRAAPVSGEDGAEREWAGSNVDIDDRKRAEHALRERTATLETINRVNLLLTGHLDLTAVVQSATDAAKEISGAGFGAFFYNVVNDSGEAYLLYTLSGASPEHFEKIGMPRNTPIFAPTFAGERIIRSDDITKDSAYGTMSPHHGMPEGHLPVRSYLAVPVVSRSGEVHGGIFLGHPEVGVFTDQAEQIVSGIAAQAAVAIDNARLYERLSESEERFRALSEAIPAVVWTCRPDGYVTYLNPRWTDFTGQTRQEYEGYGWVEALHPDDRRAVLDLWAHCTQTGQAYEGEGRYRSRNGQYRWHYFHGIPLLGEDGVVVAWYGTSLDIHERKAAEEALQESERRLRLAQQAARIGVFEWNIQADVSEWSPELEAIYGLAPGEFSGSSNDWRSFVHPEDLVMVNRCSEQAMQSGQLECDFRIVCPDGKIKWLTTRAQVFHDAAGAPFRMIGVNVDITELKTAEEALQENDRRKDEFLATLAHELRNPLAPIRTGIDLLKMLDDPVEREAVRAAMQRQAEHLVVLVDDLLDVSRITSGKFELRRSRTDLGRIVRTAIESSESLIREAEHEFSVDLPDAPIEVEADPHRLAQVLSNLLSNAVKYTPKGGRIRLAARAQGRDVVITVQDTGVGIPTEMQPRVFDMFAQIPHPLSAGSPSLGIGLTLVKSLVEMHGGTIQVRSEGLNRGTEFRIRAPIVAEPEKRLEARTPTADGAGGPDKRRVLVVDDNQTAIAMLCLLLQKQGHEVRPAANGQEAVEVAREFRPDFILMDLGMPTMDGYEAAKRIRSEPWGRDLTLVALTGWGQDRDKKRTKAAGFDHHLVKPADLSKLRRLLADADPRPASA